MIINNLFTARAVSALVLAGVTVIAEASQTPADDFHYPGRSHYSAPRAESPPDIDGLATESVWAQAPWREVRHRWLGPAYPSDDFQGRFKVAWTPQRLYILFEFVDDVLFDRYADPLVQYWDDDCLEIFVDEDFSGGDHQYSHNAFAYHIGLDNQAIDIGVDRNPANYSHHIESRWRRVGGKVVWEVAIDIYSDDYVDGSPGNRPEALFAGKVIGLMLAYCDNDASELRENFIGSESVPSGPKDRGWIDAGLFGQLELSP